MRARCGAAPGGAALLAAGAVLLAATLASPPPVAAQEPAAAPPAAARPRPLGLVEVPTLFGVVRSGEPSVQVVRRSRPIELRREPSADAPALRVAERPAQIEAREHGQELLSAVVYGESEGWYRVRFLDDDHDELLWLAPGDAGTYRDLRQLLAENPAHLTGDWDRRFHARPRADARAVPVRSDRPEVDVLVVRAERVEGEVWFLVLAFEPGPCTGPPEEERVVGAGWVPSHAANGEPNLWFYARGC